MDAKIRIVVVDDHAFFREGVVWILENEPDFEVVGQGASAEEAVELVHSLSPQIILLDINMPGDGFSAAQHISDQSLPTRIAFLTVSDDEHYLMKALDTGACAYILKGTSGRELVRILRGVHSGNCYVPPSLADIPYAM